MRSEDIVMEIEIASIVPTVYRARICAIDKREVEGPVLESNCVRCAIERQMNELTDMWAQFTKSSLKLRHQTHLSEEPVRRLQRKTKAGLIQITEPSPKKVYVSLAPKATFWFFWILYRDDIAENLKGVNKNLFAPHADNRRAWLPWKYSDLISRPAFRPAVNHEFKHCLVHLMCEAGVDPQVLPTRKEERAKKHGPFFKSRYLAGLLLARGDYWTCVSKELDDWGNAPN